MGQKVKQAEASEPRPPASLTLFYMLSHLEDDGPVRMDGVKLGVCEVMGLEIDEPKLGAFVGALNAMDFPVQLLVRQHSPRLGGLRDRLRDAKPQGLPSRTDAAADSLQRLLEELESRDGVLDRRFYAVCDHGRCDDLKGLLVRAGLSVHRLQGRQLRMFMGSVALGGSPYELQGNATVNVEIGRRELRIEGSLARSLHLAKWPRSLAPGFLQGLMVAGAPMDISIHLGPIPPDEAARTLEWQKVRFESAQSLSLRRGRTMSPEAEVALEDVSRLRDEVQRGRERLFHSSLSITLYAGDADSLKEVTQRAKAHFAATLGKLDGPVLPAARGQAVNDAPSAERGRRVAKPGHILAREAISVLPSRHGHSERHAVWNRSQGLLAGRLRSIRRHPHQRQHSGPCQVWKRKELLHEARSSPRDMPRCYGLRHRS